MHVRFTEIATTHLHYWKTIGVSLQQASNKGPLSMLPVAIKRYCCFSVTEVVLMLRHGWLAGHLSYIFVTWCDLGPPGRNAIEVKYLHTNDNASTVRKAHFLKANHNFTTTPTRELAAEITRTSITFTTTCQS